MSLHVLFRCNKPFSGAAEARLAKIAVVSDSSIEFTIDPLGNWKQIFKVLAENGIARISPLSIADDPFKNWKSPKEDWVAAVLDYDLRLVGINPVADYNPPVPAPERGGYIPFDEPILIDEMPSGLLASVDENRILSEDLVDFLGAGAVGRIGGDVVLEGKRLAHWIRFQPSASVDLLDKSSFLTEMPCAICGAPYIPLTGVFIGGRDKPYSGPVAIEQTGCGHFGMSHMVVVSLEQAVALSERFRGAGYTLEPVYRNDCVTARQVRELLDIA
jgi:hypothetical protein